jgi:hypothetical protein
MHSLSEPARTHSHTTFKTHTHTPQYISIRTYTQEHTYPDTQTHMNTLTHIHIHTSTHTLSNTQNIRTHTLCTHTGGSIATVVHKRLEDCTRTRKHSHTHAHTHRTFTGGSIATVVHNFGPLEDATARKFTSQILAGMEYLHEGRIACHLRLTNCMLADRGVVKLCDFGVLARAGCAEWYVERESDATGRSLYEDVCALGQVVVQMLGGADSDCTCTLPARSSRDAHAFVDLCTIAHMRRVTARVLRCHLFVRGKYPEDLVQADAQAFTRVISDGVTLHTAMHAHTHTAPPHQPTARQAESLLRSRTRDHSSARMYTHAPADGLMQGEGVLHDDFSGAGSPARYVGTRFGASMSSQGEGVVHDDCDDRSCFSGSLRDVYARHSVNEADR